MNVTCENVATNQGDHYQYHAAAVNRGTRAFYIKQGSVKATIGYGRRSCRLQMDGKKCQDARIVFGARPISLRREARRII